MQLNQPLSPIHYDASYELIQKMMRRNCVFFLQLLCFVSKLNAFHGADLGADSLGLV
jgi:hypothetical protein